MKTFIEIMKWAGGVIAVFGFSFSFGMIVADSLYHTALGEMYYELNVLSLWNTLGIFVIGCALATLFVILEAVFNAGERSASEEGMGNVPKDKV